MMEQLTSFYTNEYPQALRCRGDYNVIGRKLYMRYPSLKREGKKPWSALTHILSGHIRTKRHVHLNFKTVQYIFCIFEDRCIGKFALRVRPKNTFAGAWMWNLRNIL